MTDAVPTLTPEQQQMWHDWQRAPRQSRKYWTDEPLSNRAELWGNFYQACFDTGVAGGLPRQWHESFDVIPAPRRQCTATPRPFDKTPPKYRGKLGTRRNMAWHKRDGAVWVFINARRLKYHKNGWIHDHNKTLIGYMTACKQRFMGRAQRINTDTGCDNRAPITAQ